MSKVQILSIEFEIEGEKYTATPLMEKETAELSLPQNCGCGQEVCVGGWVFRCMAGGGGACVWYRTNQVC